MDGFSAFVCSAQALSHALSLAKSSFALQPALKHGGGIFHTEQTSVGLLRSIILQLTQEEAGRDPGFDEFLQPIETVVGKLLKLYEQQTRLQLVLFPVIRRAEVNESFASLERMKNTLILLLTAQKSTAIASSNMRVFHGLTRASREFGHPSKSSSVGPFAGQGSGYVSIPSSGHQSDHDYTRNAEVAPEALFQPQGVEPDPKYVNASLSPSPQEQANPDNVGTGGTFKAKLNRAKGKAKQYLFGPAHPGMNITHESNTSQGSAQQYIGLDAHNYFQLHSKARK